MKRCVCSVRARRPSTPVSRPVRAELAKLDAQIEKEEDMGVRPLAFPIKKQLQAHYYYYVCKLDPEKAHQIENAVRLKDELLRFLMVRRDDS